MQTLHAPHPEPLTLILHLAPVVPSVGPTPAKAQCAQPPPSQPLASTKPLAPEPAWRHPDHNYNVPPFRWRRGESLRRTREFPVLDSPDARRQAWHYCHVMSQQGVFAGHFEVHALSRADIAGNGRQHRIVVYTRGAHVKSGTYQLAMDTHPEGPPSQPRIFLLHDADANHYRTLTGCDTTRPPETLTARQALAVESGGAGDCLFFSVARGLGYGGHHQQAARRLRHMATSFLFHHPEESLNGDTLALFVSRLESN